MSVNPSYHNENFHSHHAHAEYPDLEPQHAQVLRVRAIAPDEATARRYRSDRGRLIIPSWNTQGEMEREQSRPDVPSIDPKTGKPRKYLWPVGSRQSIDVPPSSFAKLQDVRIPVIITESALKADAIVSELARIGKADAFCVIAVAGVYGWRSDGAPLSDHQDIRWRTAERQKVTWRRPVYLAFDSDAATKAEVARARWEYAEFLKRKSARVLIIDIPDAPNGEKQGADDAIAAGADILELIAGAYPAPSVVPSVAIGVVTDDMPEIERLRTENMQLKQLVSAQAELLRNPHLKDKPRIVGFAAITEAAAKKARGETEPDGRVRLEVSRVVNDFRPKTPRGETTPDRNPNDDSFPLTSRDNGKRALKLLCEHDGIDAEFVDVKRQHASGDWYKDVDILVRVTTSADAVRKLASFDAYKTRKTYSRQEPCSQCGEVHARTVETTRKTYCGTADDPGCGAQIAETTTTLTLPVPPANDPDATDEQRDGLAQVTAIDPDNLPADSGSGKNLEAHTVPVSSPSPPSSNYVSGKNLEADAVPPVVAGGHERKAASGLNLEPETHPLCTSKGCTNPIPAHLKYTCDECAAGMVVAS